MRIFVVAVRGGKICPFYDRCISESATRSFSRDRQRYLGVKCTLAALWFSSHRIQVAAPPIYPFHCLTGIQATMATSAAAGIYFSTVDFPDGGKSLCTYLWNRCREKRWKRIEVETDRGRRWWRKTGRRRKRDRIDPVKRKKEREEEN